MFKTIQSQVAHELPHDILAALLFLVIAAPGHSGLTVPPTALGDRVDMPGGALWLLFRQPGEIKTHASAA